MKSYLFFHLSHLKHLALSLAAFSLIGATMRCTAQAAGVQLAASPHTLSMWSMNSDSFTVTATPVGGVKVPAGAAGSTATVVSGLPGGMTASWSSPTVSSAGLVSWTLTLTGSVNAVASSGTLNLSTNITASSGKVYTASLGVPLTVSFTQPTLSFSPALTHLPIKQGASTSDEFNFIGGGSFHGAVTLTVSGLPSSVACSWSNPVALSSDSGRSTLSLTPSATSTPQWDSFTVTASGDGLSVTREYTLEVEPSAGVRVQLSNSAATIQPSGTATLSVTATPINGIKVPATAAGASAVVVSGMPDGISYSWSGPTLTSTGAATWTLNMTGNGTAVTGGYPINLSAQITDANTGLVYSANPSFTLLVSLVGLAKVSLQPGALPMNIPTNFMGLAHEWEDAEWQMGDTAVGVNTIYRRLITNLTEYEAGPINIRVGGTSTDLMGEPTPALAEPLQEFAAATGAQFELAVKLGTVPTAQQTEAQAVAQAAQIALDQATYYSSQMPAGSIDTIEIGNEVFLYTKLGLRPAGYDMQQYLQDFNTWKANIMPIVPQGVKISGPAGYLFEAGTAAEIPNITTFLADEASDLGMFTEHYYSASPEDNRAPDFLLTPAAATSGPTWFAPEVQMAHSYGLPFRVDELGSVSDGGAPGVSNTFASALWAIDTMFNYASIGVDGVNWQAGRLNYNDPFTFTTTFGEGKFTYTLESVNPIYYGLLFFQVAVGDGAQLLPITFATPANLTAWATAPESRNPRIAIINKDEALAGDVSISTTSTNGKVYSQAIVLRLTAPSYASTSGITFSGQTFDGSATGLIKGTHTEETINASSDGTFKISMPITSAALVIFQP